MKNSSEINQNQIKKFNPNYSRLQYLSDDQFHFPLFIPGVGKIDCMINPRYNKLVFPKDLYEQWVGEGKLPSTEFKYFTELIVTPYILLHGLKACGRHIPEIKVAISRDVTQVVGGMNILRIIRGKKYPPKKILS